MKLKQSDHLCIYMHQIYNGGIERVYFNLAHSLVDRGVSIDLVVDNLSWSPFLEQLPNSVRIVDLEVKSFLHRIPRLIKYLKRECPDAILSAQHFANEVAIVAATLSRQNIRVVVSEHTTLSADSASHPWWNLRRNLLPFIGMLTYRGNVGIVAVSHGVAKDIARLFKISPSRIITIYNPALNPNIKTLAEIRPDHPWFEHGAPPVILGVGRLEKQKNFSNLIRAFAIVSKARDARLIILGEGSLRNELLAEVNNLELTEHVQLLGFLENPYSYLAHSAVFALSSDWEGLPTVVIEALYVGTPVVSTDCPSGASEILDSGRYGRLVPTGNAHALAEAIIGELDKSNKPAPPTAWLEQFTQEYAATRYASILNLTTHSE